jgi:hypothetical protein
MKNQQNSPNNTLQNNRHIVGSDYINQFKTLDKFLQDNIAIYSAI